MARFDTLFNADYKRERARALLLPLLSLRRELVLFACGATNARLRSRTTSSARIVDVPLERRAFAKRGRLRQKQFRVYTHARARAYFMLIAGVVL